MKRETCFTCDMVFEVTDNFQANRIADGKYFSCPNGHKQHYTGRDEKIAKLKNHLTTMTEDRDWYYKRNQENILNFEHEQRRRTGCQGMIKRLQNEIEHLKQEFPNGQA